MDTKATEQFFQDLHQEIGRVGRQILVQEGQEAAVRMRRRFVTWPGGSPFGNRDFLNIRGARLIRVIGSNVFDEDGGPVLEVGNLSDDEKLQRISEQQETGRENIVPTTQPMMILPWAAGLNRDGTRRFANLRDAAREFSIFEIPDARGSLVFGRRRGVKNAPAELLAVKRRTVSVPPRPVVRPEREKALANIMERLGRELPSDGSAT